MALALLCSLPVSAGLAAPHVPFQSSRALDLQIEATLETLTSGDLPRARVLARQLAWRFPTFALGQLLTAELESIAALNNVRVSSSEPISTPLMKLLLEAQARIDAPTARAHSMASFPATAPTVATSTQNPRSPLTSQAIVGVQELPDDIVQLGTGVSNLILVDLQHSTLRHLVGQDGVHTIVSQHYIGSGKAGFGKSVEGDNKTPLGVYTITGLRSDASLPDLYGSGALMLDYPNALDRYEGRTGYGIWLHGVPHNQRSRAPRSSEGCVTMSNDHLISLRDQINVSDTLVFLGHHFNWSSEDVRQQRRDEYRQLFTRFQQAWVEQDLPALVGLYEQPEALWQRLDETQNHLLKVGSDTQGQIHSPAFLSGTESVAARSSLQTAATARFDDDLVPADAQQPHQLADQQPSSSLLAKLANVDASTISIFMNPALPEPYANRSRDYLVMRVRLGSMNENEITLYWGRSSDRATPGDWQIVAEHWHGRKS